MEINMLEAAGQALLVMLDPMRLLFLALGVVIGLALGVIPGLGGIVGLALLLPFTFDMDPFAAFAMLLGLLSVTTTSDTIPAVLFGVPGTAGSAATILDGHPMAKKGQAGRAFGAAYTASLLGGLLGALLLGLSIPLLRPIMLYIGSPELLSFAIFGLSMVAVLASGSPLRGLAAAGFGLMLAMIGSDPQTGTLRWTFDSLYLWDGLPLVPLTIGLFALPEIADLAIGRRTIAVEGKLDSRSGRMQGVRDVFVNWWLVIRCAWLGAALGAVPGIGSSVVDWIAYGHAARTVRGATETFGKGDVRGVIAPESCNNAKDGGSLVPTVAFGVPGSASMAILLGVFLIHGLVPGPDMLGKNLDVTYSMVWSIAIANILGAGICFAFSDQLAKLALIRYSVMTPLILSVVFVGAFQASRQWGDLYALLFFGVLGWTMKRMKWPRPPLILGVVLGGIVERYMFISVERYGAEWLGRPVVIGMFILAFIGLVRPFLSEVKNAGGLTGMFGKFSRPGFDIQTAFYLVFIAAIAYLLWEASGWNRDAKLVPMIVGTMALVVATVSLFNHTFRRGSEGGAGEGIGLSSKAIHMDLEATDKDLGVRKILIRAAGFLGWLLAFFALTVVFGMIPALVIFVFLYMKLEGNESWLLTSICATAMGLFSWGVFDKLLALPWPQTFIGDWVPALKFIPSV